MLELKFYSRDGRLAYDPTRARRQGQLPPYIGRTFDPKTRSAVADSQPYVVRINEAAPEAPKWLSRVTKQAQRGDIWCADEATAKRLSVPYHDVARVDGEWVEKAAKAPSGKHSGGKKGSD